MTLNEFRIEKKWTFKELGAALGVSTSRAWYLCQAPDDQRQRTPEKEEMERIIALSEGRVEPNSFYNLPQRAA